MVKISFGKKKKNIPIPEDFVILEKSSCPIVYNENESEKSDKILNLSTGKWDTVTKDDAYCEDGSRMPIECYEYVARHKDDISLAVNMVYPLKDGEYFVDKVE